MFVFFGLVAVNGSYYVQLEELEALPVLLSIPIGLLSAAILVVNNVRDIDTDRRAGKSTLAVRLGRERSRDLYALMIAAAFALLPVALLAERRLGGGLLGLLSAPLAVPPLRSARARRRPVAERRPGRHRCAPRRLQPAGLGRAADA